MKLIKLYQWIAGSQSDFTKQFQNNELLFNQARSFWNKLDGSILFVLISMLVVSIGVAIWYYTYYNNIPGRHYKFKYWLLSLASTFILVLASSFAIEYILFEPKLPGSGTLEFLIALCNAIYGVISYFIISVFWCNFLPTNACRIFKLGRK